MDAGTQNSQAPDPPEPQPRRLMRSRSDRMVAGVAGGFARYLGLDATLVRIVMVALVLAGGAGFVLYVAGLLLMPEEPPGAACDGDAGGGDVGAPLDRPRRVAALVAVAVAALVAAGAGLHWLWALSTIACIALIGLLVWWLVAGRDSSARPADLLRRSVAGLALLAVSVALVVAGGWIAGAGGGVAVAIAVIVAGAALVAGAFYGGARWLIPPALGLAAGVALVSASDLDLHGGVGDRSYVAASAAEVKPSYQLGVGRLVVDLRQAHLPAGDQHVRVRVGVGEAVVLVPRNACVVARAHVGTGAARVFERVQGGIDVTSHHVQPPRPGRTRVFVDANIGIGAIEVRRTDDPAGAHFGFPQHRSDVLERQADTASCKAVPGAA